MTNLYRASAASAERHQTQQDDRQLQKVCQSAVTNEAINQVEANRSNNDGNQNSKYREQQRLPFPLRLALH